MVCNTDMMHGTPLNDTTNSQMVRNTDMMLGTPLADITNSQIIRNTDMMQNDVSPYYREIYAKRFLVNTIQTNSNNGDILIPIFTLRTEKHGIGICILLSCFLGSPK
ncbi:Hypothetical predicted protein [Mytilus galloprovincialis]|uniref:Uncharacterized protein n=1 Tax=Mytilus galloprovincialis TaxID=29158 RepID=A0A8B6EL09_MYTGA|nr:Hypothetical predicted protein [Mytilus galloprovincialis]